MKNSAFSTCELCANRVNAFVWVLRIEFRCWKSILDFECVNVPMNIEILLWTFLAVSWTISGFKRYVKRKSHKQCFYQRFNSLEIGSNPKLLKCVDSRLRLYLFCVFNCSVTFVFLLFRCVKLIFILFSSSMQLKWYNSTRCEWWFDAIAERCVNNSLQFTAIVIVVRVQFRNMIARCACACGYFLATNRLFRFYHQLHQ